MIGFVTTVKTAAEVLDAIRDAQLSRGHAHFWTTGSKRIYTGDYAGKTLIPASDDILDTPLRQGLTPRDFPEFTQLIETLGGLAARVDVDQDDMVNPDTPNLEFN
jgi:hypothetical protein